MPSESVREIFVHLAYLDDSGTRDRASRFQVMAGVIIEGWEFEDIELTLGIAVEFLIPEEKRDKFEEFHAWELFGGYGPFEGIEQKKRFEIIRSILEIIGLHKVPVVYGAVNCQKLADDLYGSADPLDICFRICVEGIQSWAARHIKSLASTDSTVEQSAHPVVLLICDDFKEGQIKTAIRKSFRRYRPKQRPPDYDLGKGWRLHDDLYFGSSKESVGIQLADLCAYIIRKHLDGDSSVAGFYDLIKDWIFYFQVEPKEVESPNANAKGQAAQ